LAEVVFWDGEDHGDGLNLRDNGEREISGRLHDVAGIDETQADPSGDWRDDVAIVHLDLIELDHAFVEFQSALLLENDFFLIVESLFRDGVAVPGIVITLEVHLCLGEKIGVAFERTLCLKQGGLVGAGVNVNQRIAFADELALLVMDSGDDAVYLAGDRGRVNGRDGADRIEVDADVALLRGCTHEVDRATATSGRFRGGRRSVTLAQDEVESHREDEEHKNPDDGLDTFVPGGRNERLMLRTRGWANILISRQVGDPLS